MDLILESRGDRQRVSGRRRSSGGRGGDRRAAEHGGEPSAAHAEMSREIEHALVLAKDPVARERVEEPDRRAARVIEAEEREATRWGAGTDVIARGGGDQLAQARRGIGGHHRRELTVRCPGLQVAKSS